MPKCEISFAPLQGYTDFCYRNAFDNIFGGVDFYYTPFIRIERGGVRQRDIVGIKPENNKLSVPLIPQIIASSSDEFNHLLENILPFGYKEININMGCPFPMIVNKGKGAGLLPFTEKIDEILSNTQHYEGVSFSVKMRLGMSNPKESLALIPIFEKYKITKIIMHPRLASQQYKGVPDMESFSSFYEKCNIPLIYNGDIKSVTDIDSFIEKFPKLSGVMIGRGLLEKPELAYIYKNDVNLSNQEIVKKYGELHNAVKSGYEERLNGGEPQLLDKMKEFWEYFYPEYDKKKRKQIKKATTMRKYLDAIMF